MALKWSSLHAHFGVFLCTVAQRWTVLSSKRTENYDEMLGCGGTIGRYNKIRECLSRSTDHHCTTTSLPVILQPHTQMWTVVKTNVFMYSQNKKFFYIFVCPFYSYLHCIKYVHEGSFTLSLLQPNTQHFQVQISMGLDVIDLDALSTAASKHHLWHHSKG